MKYKLLFLLLIPVIGFGQVKYDSLATITSKDSLFTTSRTWTVGGEIYLIYPQIKYDTIPAVLLVCDTSFIGSLERHIIYLNVNKGDSIVVGDATHRAPYVWWKFGYEVRNVDSAYVDVSVNPNTIRPDGSSTLLGWLPDYKKVPTYSHKEYLDENKKPIHKSTIIWLVKNRQP